MIHPLLQIFGSMGQECRYTPSCSRYAQEAFTQYSFFKAFRLSLERLLRCHPWTSRSGFDPLPEEGRGPLSVVESRIRS